MWSAFPKMIPDSQAPCIAVVGPANAGKTTLLHQLDEKLNRHLDSFLILKGNPDGTGRYLFQAPDLREALKESVKGKWGSATVEQICDRIVQGRRNLSLALLDFGGLHNDRTAPGNARMLCACSHYLLITRDNDSAGAELWNKVCGDQGLVQVGWMRSLPYGGPTPALISDSTERFEGSFQVGIRPGDPRNDTVLDPLVERLRALSRSFSQIPYVNLYRPERWGIDMIPLVAGQADKIGRLASSTGVVVIGGKAPVWAYLGALRCALNTRPDARVFFFDPQQPQPLVEIPAAPAGPAGKPDAFPTNALNVFWRQEGERSILELQIRTVDKELPPLAAQNLEAAPSPLPAPSSAVGLYGRGPLWLFGTYARWLVTAGAQRLASWDVGTKKYIQIWR